MQVLTAALLGLIQGITEFLPISSSGHLVLAQHFLPGFSQPGILFDAVLHFGTLFAVLYYFRSQLFSYTLQFWVLIGIGTIPAVLAAILFGDALEAMFTGSLWIGVQLIITGLLNFVVDKFNNRKNELNPTNSFLIGIAQAIAIIPGISRSGSTIVTGVVLGVDKKKVAEYSFLMSVPAILGANILQIYKYGFGGELEPTPYLVGFAFAFVSGFLSIKVLLTALMEKRFKIFGYYSIALGIIAIILLQ